MREQTGIQLWVLLTDPLTEAELEEMQKTGSAFRLRKIERIQAPGKKRQAIAAAYLLGKLQRYLQLTTGEEGQNAYGKPFFTECPQAAFSLSHTEGCVVLAFDPKIPDPGIKDSGRKLGADAERIRQAPMRVAKRFFSQAAYEELRKAEQEADRNRQFFSMWTEKEAAVKCLGTGIQTPLLRTDSIAELERIAGEKLLMKSYTVTEAGQTYCITLCAGGTVQKDSLPDEPCRIHDVISR